MEWILLVIAFAASVIGAICGIGGGVIIKPVLDGFGFLGVREISFLSGCTVLAMSAYSLFDAKCLRHEKLGGGRTAVLALGAAFGGLAGKLLFQRLAGAGGGTVGAVQSLALFVLTVGTMLYTLFQDRISAREVRNTPVIALAGLVLGVLSSFLGIGGGPFNIVILSYLFSMDAKTAARNSLFVIFVSQLASLAYTLASRTAPAGISLTALAVMIAGGVGGGILGRTVSARLRSAQVSKLFLILQAVILALCLYNAWRYLAAA